MNRQSHQTLALPLFLALVGPGLARATEPPPVACIAVHSQSISASEFIQSTLTAPSSRKSSSSPVKVTVHVTGLLPSEKTWSEVGLDWGRVYGVQLHMTPVAASPPTLDHPTEREGIARTAVIPSKVKFEIWGPKYSVAVALKNLSQTTFKGDDSFIEVLSQQPLRQPQMFRTPRIMSVDDFFALEYPQIIFSDENPLLLLTDKGEPTAVLVLGQLVTENPDTFADSLRSTLRQKADLTILETTYEAIEELGSAGISEAGFASLKMSDLKTGKAVLGQLKSGKDTRGGSAAHASILFSSGEQSVGGDAATGKLSKGPSGHGTIFLIPWPSFEVIKSSAAARGEAHPLRWQDISWRRQLAAREQKNSAYLSQKFTFDPAARVVDYHLAWPPWLLNHEVKVFRLDKLVLDQVYRHLSWFELADLFEKIRDIDIDPNAPDSYRAGPFEMNGHTYYVYFEKWESAGPENQNKSGLSLKRLVKIDGGTGESESFPSYESR
ncbi:MAG: hypothetical protein C5B49_05085 [Bdellovibrio sp.]|nr:MAG: hypothetical protein C5B49_05085 [Bdellovibrio sp.]